MKTLSEVKPTQHASKYFHSYFIYCCFLNSPFHIPPLPFSKNNWAAYTFLLANVTVWTNLTKLPSKSPCKEQLLPNVLLQCSSVLWPSEASSSEAWEWWGYQGSTSLSSPVQISSLFFLLVSFAFPFQSRVNFPKSQHQPDSSGFYNERFYLFWYAEEGRARLDVFEISFSNYIKV